MVTGSVDQHVTWAVDGFEGGNATVGTITSDGLYTAPPEVPSPAVVHVQARSVPFPALVAQADVEIVPGGLVVAMPIDLRVVRPGLGDPGGLPANVTVGEPTSVTVVRPGTGDPGGLPNNLTVGEPPIITVVRPGTGDSGGHAPNVTVAQPHDIRVTRE